MLISFCLFVQYYTVKSVPINHHLRLYPLRRILRQARIISPLDSIECNSSVSIPHGYSPPPHTLTQMWLKEAEDVTWDRFSESLATIEQTELAERVEERLGQYHEQQKTVGKETVESSDVQVRTVRAASV